MALLDTTALIDLTRSRSSAGYLSVSAVISQLNSRRDILATSRINDAEFRVGVYRADDMPAESAKVRSVLAGLIILEFDEAAADQFARIQAGLLASGRPIGEADTMIAAVAIVNRHSIVTRNVRQFSLVPGLTVLTY